MVNGVVVSVSVFNGRHIVAAIVSYNEMSYVMNCMAFCDLPFMKNGYCVSTGQPVAVATMLVTTTTLT